MALSTFIKQAAITAGVIGTATLSNLAISAPSDAFTIGFDTWAAASGSLSNTSSNISIPGQGEVTLSTENSVNNIFGELEIALDLDPDTYPLNAPPGSEDIADFAYQGSALTTFLNAGDTLKFDWAFNQFQTDEDYAFILFNGVLETLANNSGSGSFIRTFDTAGTFSFGVVDIGDYSGNSELIISRADLTPVPTPSLIPGLIGVGIGILRKRNATIK